MTVSKQEVLLQTKDGFCGGGLGSRGLESGDQGSLPLTLVSPALWAGHFHPPLSRTTVYVLVVHFLYIVLFNRREANFTR